MWGTSEAKEYKYVEKCRPVVVLSYDNLKVKTNKVFNFLMKYKVKYDDNEHQEYLKSLNKK